MSAPKVSGIDSIHDLLRHPLGIEMVTDALAKAKLPESAEEFLEFTPLTTRLAAAVGPKLGEDLGLQSQTRDAVALSHRYGYVLLGLLCGIAEQGISITQLDERIKAEDCLIVATVPSSALAWNGELSAHVSGRQSDYRIEASVTFKGQKFAWGRGKRILKRLFQDVERYARGYETNNL
jgi:hypothetical protein